VEDTNKKGESVVQKNYDIKFLTWNVYLGGDISKIVGAKPKTLPRRVKQLWETVQATDFSKRAKKMAQIISEHSPDVLALQEVFRWVTIKRQGLKEPIERVEFDFLSSLRSELGKAGCPYFVASHSLGVNVTLPLDPSTDLRLEDSVVLLLKVQPAKSKLSKLNWENARQARFTENQRSTIDDEPFSISRGWASIDLRDQDKALRIATTHMEYFGEDVKSQQVVDILHDACGVSGPRIILGDFNSTGHSNTAELFKQNGYKDAWVKLYGGKGFTSSQDDDLRNPVPDDHYQRLDWILYRGNIKPITIKKIGHLSEDKLTNGQWPSDHAGVFAQLQVTFDERRVRADPEEPADNAIEVVRKLFERFMKLDVVGAAEAFHPDARLVFPGNEDILPWAGEFRGASFTRFASLVLDTVEYKEYRVKHIWGNGDRVVALTSERCKVKANNRYFEHDLIAIIKVKNGLITEFIEFSDTGKMERAIQDIDD
jgi:endonuclease/exonuclease/phosphatase family metal-dependent hydrolase/ketosteroid isomerase-like protein